MLADPRDSRAGVTENGHRLVGDAGSRSEQEGSDGGGRDVRHPVRVLRGDRVGVPVHGAPLQVDEGQTVPDPGEFTR